MLLNWSVCGLLILADAIFHFSHGKWLLYRFDTLAFSASESEDILHGFLKDATLSPPLNLHICNSHDQIVADVIFGFSRASSRLYRCNTSAFSSAES